MSDEKEQTSTVIDTEPGLGTGTAPQTVNSAVPRTKKAGIAMHLEMLGLFGVLVAIDIFLTAKFDAFYELNPNPYWIPVLLMAVNYGAGPGLVAALIASFISFAGQIDPLIVRTVLDEGPMAAWQQVTAGSFTTFSNEDYLVVWDYVVMPLLWLMTALGLGLLRERLKDREHELRTALDASEHREAVLSDAYERLLETKEGLEVRVAGQLKTVFTIYQAAKAIEKLGPGEVLIGVSELVRTVMSPVKFSVYLLNENVLEAVLNEGWDADDRYQTRFDNSTLLFQDIVGGRQFLVAVNPDEERALGGEGLMAGPLTSVDSGEVVGMLKIEKLNFLDLGKSSVENFRILSDWIGTAFANAQRFRKAQANRFYDEDRLLLTDTVYKQQSKQIRRLAEELNFDLTTIIIKLTNPDGGLLSTDARGAAARALRELVDQHMTALVTAYEYRKSGREFALLMPMFSISNKKELSDRIVQGIDYYLRAAGVENLKVTATVRALHVAEQVAEAPQNVTPEPPAIESA